MRRHLHLSLFVIAVFIFSVSSFAAATRAQTGSSVRCSLIPRQPYKVSGNSAIWYITTDCRKAAIRNSTVYFSYFTSWAQVRTVTVRALNAIPSDTRGPIGLGPRYIPQNGSLVKSPAKPDIYLIIEQNAYPIATEAAFTHFGWQFRFVEEISPEVLARYTIKPALLGPENAPPGLVFKYAESPRVFRVELQADGTVVRRQITNMKALRSSYRPDRIAILPATVVFRGDDAPGLTLPLTITSSTPSSTEALLQLESELLALLDGEVKLPYELPALPAIPTIVPTPQVPILPLNQIPAITSGRMVLANDSSAIGTNVFAFTDANHNWPYANFFKQARPWISGERSGCFDCGPALDLDEFGWVRSLRADVPNGGQVARTVILSGDDGSLYPAGRYTVMYDGDGMIEYSGAATRIAGLSRPGRDIVEVMPRDRLSFFLAITRTNPANYIRNIRVYPPGGACANDAARLCMTDSGCSGQNLNSCRLFAAQGEAVQFYPPFLANSSRYSVIRFTQAMQTNAPGVENIREFRDYTSLLSAMWYRIPPEMMARMGNILHSDIWVSIPVNASDDFVRTFATRLRDTLDVDRRVYVEYSNESWNLSPPFADQHREVAIHGCERNLELQAGCDQDANPGNGLYCEGHPRSFNQSCSLAERIEFSRRTIQVGRIFREVFSNSPRVVRVMASQSGNSGRHTRLLMNDNAWQEVDVLATNPYFGAYLGNSSFIATTTLSDLFTELETVSIPFTLDEVRRDSGFLQQNFPHLDLLAYSGGQHLVPVGQNQNDARFLSLFTAANRDSRMSALYARFLSGWRASGGRIFLHSADVSPQSQYGSFGALEIQNERWEEAPKFTAISSFIDHTPCWWPVCRNATSIGPGLAFVERRVPTTTPVVIIPPATPTTQSTSSSTVVARPVSSGFLPPLIGYGDEFTDARTQFQWVDRGGVEGDEPQVTRWDVNATVPGSMVIVPRSAGGIGWDGANRAPFYYKNVTGNFVIVARMNAHSLRGPSFQPDRAFNIGGILARNPSGAARNALQSWVFGSSGTQMNRNVRAVAAYSVMNSVSDANQFAISGDMQINTIRLCRVGSNFRIYRAADINETSWLEVRSYDRPDLPQTLQVGLLAAAGEVGSADAQIDVEYIRAAVPATTADCVGRVAPESAPSATPVSPAPVTTPVAINFQPNGSTSPTIESVNNEAANVPAGTLPRIAGFGDEFTNSETRNHWIDRSTVESSAVGLVSLWDVNTTAPGAMTIIPRSTGGLGWDNTLRGPFYYKNISGNFVVHARMLVRSLGSPFNPPNRVFNLGGLLVRNPSAAIAGNSENWVFGSIGTQDLPSNIGQAALSVTNNVSTGFRWFGGSSLATVRICRFNDVVRVYRANDISETVWTEIQQYNRPDLPQTLQVGMFAAAGEAGVSDARIEVDYIRAGQPQSEIDCTSLVQAEPNPSSIVISPNISSSQGSSPSPSPSPSSPSGLTPIAGFSDEFTSASTLSNWISRQTAEGTANQISLWDSNTTVLGNMVLLPSQGNLPWYDSAVAPFIFKTITGNFVVTTRVNSHSVMNSAIAPTQPYNGAGLMVRGPTSAGGIQNWIGLNVGNGNELASVNTVNSGTLILTNGSNTNTYLRICRLGSEFTLYQSIDNEATWNLVNTFTRSDLPQTLQVGMMLFAANTFGNPDVQGDFDYIRAAVPTSQSDCTASIGAST